MSEFIVYHNPRCSKSRAALEILRQRGVEPTVIEYLKTPPDVPQLAALLKKLGQSAREILRDGEDEFEKLRLADPGRSDAELLAAVAEHPILLQRPIVVKGNRAVIARPPERVTELL